MSKQITNNFIISLLSKPFVVLTGNSGTGKTRMALKVVEQLERNTDKVFSWRNLELNPKGRIQNVTEEEIRDFCFDSNVFVAKINEKEYEIKIEMAVQIFCDDPEFWENLKKNGYEIVFGAAKIIPPETRHVLIPVGADWTDGRNLLGYINPFGAEGKTIYEITPIIEIILKALHPDNQSFPHFIILDEMNLSHVERYFSSFLSIMEANRSTSDENGLSLLPKNEMSILYDTLKSNGNYEEKLAESLKILIDKNLNFTLPPNIFIIGTVNVDETTYMFSPKVLDRAHIIELETVDPSQYFNGSFSSEDEIHDRDKVLECFKYSIEYRAKEYERKNYINQLSHYWKDESEFNRIKEKLNILLSGIYQVLKTINFDFGYRVFKEVMEYLYFSLLFHKSTEAWEEYVDRALLQKVLPKIHGNRRQLNEALDILISFLVGDNIDIYVGISKLSLKENEINLPYSIAKLKKMKLTLDNVGYTSFIS